MKTVQVQFWDGMHLVHAKSLRTKIRVTDEQLIQVAANYCRKNLDKTEVRIIMLHVEN